MAKGITIELTVDDKGTAKIKKFGDETARTGRKGTDSFKAIDKESTKMTKGFKGATTALLGMAAAVGGLALLKNALVSSVKAASDLQETTSKFNVVFAGQIPLAEKFSKSLVDGFAMSTRESKSYLSSVQDLLVPMGVAADKASKLSFEVVKLSADLGSFNNLPTSQVMLDIQSALVGNFETMKKYGVVLNATVVEQKALTMGLIDTKAELTAGIKAQAAYQLMVEGSAAAIGDMARTSEGFANQAKQLSANVEELQGKLGILLLPAITDVVKETNEWIKTNGDLISQDTGKAITAITVAIKGLVITYKTLSSLFKDTGIVGRILFGATPVGQMLKGLETIKKILAAIGKDAGGGAGQKIRMPIPGLGGVGGGAGGGGSDEKAANKQLNFIKKLNLEIFKEDKARLQKTFSEQDKWIAKGLAAQEKAAMQTDEAWADAFGEVTRSAVAGATISQTAFEQFKSGALSGLQEISGGWFSWTEFAKDSVITMANVSANALSDGLFGFLKGEMTSFEDVWNSFTDSLLRIFADMVASMVVQWAAANIFGIAQGGSTATSTTGTGLISSVVGNIPIVGPVLSKVIDPVKGLVEKIPLVGGFLSSIFHDGGVVGQGGPGRMVPASVFAGAPRAHQGLGPKERPIIAMDDETVMTPGQVMANRGPNIINLNIDGRAFLRAIVPAARGDSEFIDMVRSVA